MHDHILLNTHFNNDCYFSRDGGLAECRHVFLAGNDLPGRLTDGSGPAGPQDPARPPFVVGELGFGTGLNLAALVESARGAGLPGLPTPAGQGGGGHLPIPPGQSRQPNQVPSVTRLQFWTVEKFPLSPEAAAPALESQLADAGLLESLLALHRSLASDLRPGWNHRSLVFGQGSPATPTGSGPSGSIPGDPAPGAVTVDFHIWQGDVLDFLAAFRAGYPEVFVDAWFLDGHDPAENPDMWSPAVFQGLAGKSRSGVTTFATYTAAGVVKSGLRAAGFQVQRKPGFGRKRHMIQGHYSPLPIS